MVVSGGCSNEEDVLCAHSETGASEPRGDRLVDASRRSTGPCLYDTRSNPEGLFGGGFIPMHDRAARLFAVNAESRMSYALDCVDAPRPTLIAEST